ncbi:putative armadillo-like helical protein [Arabidopsis thaliana]
MLGVESQWAPVAVRCMTFKCIGDLIDGHPKNRDILASKVLGEDRQVEPALNSILRIILQTSSIQEFVAADYVFKTFCEYVIGSLSRISFTKRFQKNTEGQTMLASTLIPQPHPTSRDPLEDDVHMSFGRCHLLFFLLRLSQCCFEGISLFILIASLHGPPTLTYFSSIKTYPTFFYMCQYVVTRPLFW